MTAFVLIAFLCRFCLDAAPPHNASQCFARMKKLCHSVTLTLSTMHAGKRITTVVNQKRVSKTSLHDTSQHLQMLLLDRACLKERNMTKPGTTKSQICLSSWLAFLRVVSLSSSLRSGCPLRVMHQIQNIVLFLTKALPECVLQ